MRQGFVSNRRRWPWGFAIAGTLLLAAITGCRHGDKCKPADCADIPPGAIPQPLGTYSCQWQNAQTGRAERDDFVIFRYEWKGRTWRLTEGGRRHVVALSKRLPEVAAPVVLEPTGNAELDEERRQVVAGLLASYGYEQAAEQVVLGHSLGEGLYGQEAQPITRNLFRQRGTRGSSGATTGGFRGGFRGALGGSLRAF